MSTVTSGNSDTLWQLDAVSLSKLAKTGQVSCREIVDAHLARIEDLNPALNAVVRVLADEARANADAADRARATGARLGPLFGVPATTKVNTDQVGLPTDNGVTSLRDVIAPADNPCIANLRAAGAIIVGRTNTPAFSMRWHTDNALHGPTVNPWDATRTPGGSSGGAASSVAAGMAPIGQGNDIAGSVRYPAYCCGLVGLRPSFGRVPAFNPSSPGARPISAQLMSVQGPLTRRVADARLAFAAMARGDSNDARWVDVPLEERPLPSPTRVALVRNPAGRGVAPEVDAAVVQAGKWLEEAGMKVEEVEPPELGAVADLWARLGMDDVIASMEPAIAEHGDDGIRRAVGFWREGFPPQGPQAVLDALVERDRLLRLWQLFIEDYPLIVMPSSGELAFKVGRDVDDFAAYESLWRAQLPQLVLPVLGLPGVAVPTGVHAGVPNGVQISSGRYREDWCLVAAEIIEARAMVATPVFVP